MHKSEVRSKAAIHSIPHPVENKNIVSAISKKQDLLKREVTAESHCSCPVAPFASLIRNPLSTERLDY